MIVVPIKVFSRFLAMSEVDFWCINAWGKQTREMDTALSKSDRSWMRYRYFVDFRHGISVFANFSNGIAVLATPPPGNIREALCLFCWPQLIIAPHICKTLLFKQKFKTIFQFYWPRHKGLQERNCNAFFSICFTFWHTYPIIHSRVLRGWDL